ncbi:hypothetical protein JCM14469_25030 [Desulfatiferula olefinivorans]
MTAGLLMLLVFSMTGAGGGLADTGRNPFEEPSKRESLYNYSSAFRNLSLSGILRFEETDRCIVRVATTGRLSVLGTGDEVRVRLGGLTHTFSVTDIREKTVTFTDKNQRRYEVEIP